VRVEPRARRYERRDSTAASRVRFSGIWLVNRLEEYEESWRILESLYEYRERFRCLEEGLKTQGY